MPKNIKTYRCKYQTNIYMLYFETYVTVLMNLSHFVINVPIKKKIKHFFFFFFFFDKITTFEKNFKTLVLKLISQFAVKLALLYLKAKWHIKTETIIAFGLNDIHTNIQLTK